MHRSREKHVSARHIVADYATRNLMPQTGFTAPNFVTAGVAQLRVERASQVRLATVGQPVVLCIRHLVTKAGVRRDSGRDVYAD